MPMRTEVRMPNLGYDMESGKITCWLKQAGEEVERGEPIAEIEADKTTIEIEAVAAGTLVEIVVSEGSDAAVGEVIAYIE